MVVQGPVGNDSRLIMKRKLMDEKTEELNQVKSKEFLAN
jgi:hypothetical protein